MTRQSHSNMGNKGKSTTQVERVAQLETMLELLNNQRKADLDRFRRLTHSFDRLTFQLAERDAELAGLDTNATLSKGSVPAVEAFQLHPAAIRSKLRDEQSHKSTLIGRLTAALILRFAREAARRRNYARAEALYQAILLLAPRPFIWRQMGNMLAGQGLFHAAVDCFDRTIELDEYDAEAWHARAVALKRLGRTDESSVSAQHAIALEPLMASRQVG